MSASIMPIRARIAIPVLAAALAVVLFVLLGGALAPQAQAAVGEFQPLASSEADLTSEAVDPTTNLIYAQENGGTKFFVYDPRTDKWSELPEAPINSGNNGGAVYLNGKIYVSYTHESEELSVYDIAKNEWTTIKNPLELGTANITAVGDSLYLADENKFVKYNPITEVTTELAEVPDYKEGNCESGFERWGGLHPYEGKIYGHQGDGCDGFWSYDIAKNEWTQLPKLPEEAGDGAVAGGAVDPVTGTYYADGNYDENHLFIYDIAKNEWTTVEMPFLVEDAGMAYVSLPGLTGIYAIQGEEGVEFTRYTTREPEADLAMGNSASASGTTVGSQFTYTVTVTNHGPNESTGVSVSDPLPSNVSYVSSTTSQGSCTGGATVTCAVGALANGGSAAIAITVKATAVGTATNTATVSAETKDPNAANNAASASTAIASNVPPLNPARWLVHGGKLLVHSGAVSDPLVNLNPTLSLAGPARLVTYGKGAGTLLATATVSLPAGATQRLTLHLSSAALKKVTGRRVKVQLRLTLHDELGRNVNASGVYLLVGPPRKHHKKHHHKKK